MWLDKLLNFQESVRLEQEAFSTLLNARTKASEKYRSKMRLLDKADHFYSEHRLALDLNGDQGPDYSKPNIVAAYLSKYHLNHCVMAYQIFSIVLKQAHMDEVRNIYVCDVGSGIGAGLAGLLLALGQQKKCRNIYFDMIESSREMAKAEKYFYEEMKCPSEISLQERQFKNSSFEMPILPTRTIRIVSAFHLTWPYNSYNLKMDYGSAPRTTNQVLKRVKPHLGLFTGHIRKTFSIKKTVAEYFSSRNFRMGECSVPPRLDSTQTPKDAQFLWAWKQIFHHAGSRTDFFI